MKYLIVMIILIIFIACEQGAQQISSLDNDQQKISYSIGTDIGKNLKRGMYEIDMLALSQGIRDASISISYIPLCY